MTLCVLAGMLKADPATLDGQSICKIRAVTRDPTSLRARLALSENMEVEIVKGELSTQGIKESYEIGMAFASKEIPVGEILVSEYCRSWKTANLAFGEWTRKDSRLNFLPYEDYTEDHIALMKKNVMPLLKRLPLPGTNTIIIGHDDLFEAATGIYPDPQGIAYILHPDEGKSFKIIASVLPSEWATL